MMVMEGIAEFFAGLEPVTTKLIGALLILFIGFIVGRIVGVVLRRLLKSVNTDKNLRRALNLRISVEKILSQIISWLVYVAAVIMALNHIGLTTLILTVITTVVVIILALSLLLAVRDMLPNMFAGITLKYRKDIVVGDRVSVKNVDGVVEEVNLLSTRMRSGKDLIVLPNAVFQKEGFQVKKK